MSKWKYSRFDIGEIERILKDLRYNQTKYPNSIYPDTVKYSEGIDYWIEKTRQLLSHTKALAALRKPCVWTLHEYPHAYTTACKFTVPFPDAPDKEIKPFCPFCGHKIEEVT